MNSKLIKLQEQLTEMGSVLIGFSAGVDSTFLAAVATEQLGENAICITADAPMMSRREIRDSVDLASAIGLHHQLIKMNEILQEPCMTEHPANRCYSCKLRIFGLLKAAAEKRGIKWIIDGSNFDDLSEARPGMQALKELAIRSPLLECGLTKQEIRDASAAMNLPTHDKPSAPCLATRIPFGTPVTIENLARVEAAEERIRQHGFIEFRARLETTGLLIQINATEMRASDFATRWQATKKALQELTPVTLDPTGLHKGYFAALPLHSAPLCPIKPKRNPFLP